MLVQFALGIWYIISVSLYLAVIVPGVWVLLLVAKIGFFGRLFFRGGMLCVSTSRALEEFTHFLRGGGLDFEVLLLHSV